MKMFWVHIVTLLLSVGSSETYIIRHSTNSLSETARNFITEDGESVSKRSNTHKCPTPNDVTSLDDVRTAMDASDYAYWDDISVGNTIQQTGFKITHVEGNDETTFLAFVAESDQATLVAFRGSNDFQQLSDQLETQFENKGLEEVNFLDRSVKVNEYFLQGTRELVAGIRPSITNNGRRYIITGHSLGGAMASIFSIMMVDEGKKLWADNPKTVLITFGEPRVGDEAFANLHDEVIPTYRKLRVVNDRDIVPHIPLPPDYAHHSREIFLYGVWVWEGWTLKWTENLRVCEAGEDDECSSKNYNSFASSIVSAFSGKMVSDHMQGEYKHSLTSSRNHRFEMSNGDDCSSFEDCLIKSCENDSQQNHKRSTNSNKNEKKLVKVLFNLEKPKDSKSRQENRTSKTKRYKPNKLEDMERNI
ncbi:uncharacterized protein [Clytia hemisphaerica]